jgi:hypothetical protein
MGDSSLSASELRKRYHAGGSVSDANLSASQLRARYGVANNSKLLCPLLTGNIMLFITRAYFDCKALFSFKY